MLPRPVPARCRCAPPALAAAAVVAALTLPATSAAEWSSPRTLSPTVATVDDLQAVAAADGRVVATWRFRLADLAGVHAATRRSDGPWGPVHTLGTRHLSEGQVTGVGDGLSGLATFGRSHVFGLTVDPGPGLGSALRFWHGNTFGRTRRVGLVGPDPWESGTSAVDSTGAAAIAWTWMAPRRGSGTNLRPRVVVISRRASSRAPFSTQRRISPLPPAPPYGEGRGPTLSATRATIARRGRFLAVAWQRSGRIEARVSQDGARTFGPVRTLGVSSERFPEIAVAVGRGNEILVAWSGRERVTPTTYRLATRVSRGAPDGPMRTTLVARSADVSVPFPVADQFGPRVLLATPPAGGPILAWQDVADGAVVVRSRELGSGATTVTTAAHAGGAAVLEDLVVGRDGRAVLAWRDIAADGTALPRAATRVAGAAPQPLTSPGPVTRVRLAAPRAGVVALTAVRTSSGALVQAHAAVATPATGPPAR